MLQIYSNSLYRNINFKKYFHVLSFVFALLATSSALYETGDVIELTPMNFQQLVLQSDDVWVVQFYAEWCGYSVKYEEMYKELASELKDSVKVGALDAYTYPSLNKEYNVNGYPTVKFFGANKSVRINENFYGPKENIKYAAMTEKSKSGSGNNIIYPF